MKNFIPAAHVNSTHPSLQECSAQSELNVSHPVCVSRVSIQLLNMSAVTLLHSSGCLLLCLPALALAVWKAAAPSKVVQPTYFIHSLTQSPLPHITQSGICHSDITDVYNLQQSVYYWYARWCRFSIFWSYLPFWVLEAWMRMSTCAEGYFRHAFWNHFPSPWGHQIIINYTTALLPARLINVFAAFWDASEYLRLFAHPVAILYSLSQCIFVETSRTLNNEWAKYVLGKKRVLAYCSLTVFILILHHLLSTCVVLLYFCC